MGQTKTSSKSAKQIPKWGYWVAGAVLVGLIAAILAVLLTKKKKEEGTKAPTAGNTTLICEISPLCYNPDLSAVTPDLSENIPVKTAIKDAAAKAGQQEASDAEKAEVDVDLQVTADPVVYLSTEASFTFQNLKQALEAMDLSAAGALSLGFGVSSSVLASGRLLYAITPIVFAPEFKFPAGGFPATAPPGGSLEPVPENFKTFVLKSSFADGNCPPSTC